VHIHVGHRFEWTETAMEKWANSGPYVPHIFDAEERQVPGKYGDVIKKEGVVGGILLPEYSPQTAGVMPFILLPEYSPQTAGVMPFERAREIHEAHPELIPFANLNPNVHDDPVAVFEAQLGQGARGLKIHAIHGFFFANDERLYPVYEKGTTLFRGAKMRYADPYTFDDVINDFPDMTVVLCHGGRGFWYHIAEFMAKHFTNVYIDISGLPPKNLLTYFPSMKKFCHKFLFGTDFPGVPGIRKNYDALKGLIQDDAALEQICYKNACDLFGFW